jgi:hypothetical protein
MITGSLITGLILSILFDADNNSKTFFKTILSNPRFSLIFGEKVINDYFLLFFVAIMK